MALVIAVCQNLIVLQSFSTCLRFQSLVLFSPLQQSSLWNTLFDLIRKMGFVILPFYSRTTCLFLLVFFLNYFFWLGGTCPYSFSQCPLLSNNQSVLIFLEGPSSQSGVLCCGILCSSILLENGEQAVPAGSFGMSRTEVSLNSDLISVYVQRDELTHQSILSQSCLKRLSLAHEVSCADTLVSSFSDFVNLVVYIKW